jgi:serine/threonine protein kinase
MTESRPKIIGHGSYGHIYYPALWWEPEDVAEEGPGDIRPNQVSKLMREKEATKEMTKYRFFQRADPDAHFHLGNLWMMRPSPQNAAVLSSLSDGERIVRDLDNYRMILMDYGGMTARDYANKCRAYAIAGAYNKAFKRDVLTFWKDTHRLVHGLQAMAHHGVVHHDVKPSNLVYDVSGKRLNLIDFGLVNHRDHICKRAQQGNYHLCIFYYNMPPELFFYDRARFKHWHRASPEDREGLLDEVLQSWQVPAARVAPTSTAPTATDLDTPYDEVEYSYTDSVKLTEREVKYLAEFERTLRTWQPGLTAPSLYQAMRDQFSCFVVHELGAFPDFDTFLQASIATIDTYGLGHTLLYCLVNMYYYLPRPFTLGMYALIKEMLHHDMLHRITVPVLVERYQALMALLD